MYRAVLLIMMQMYHVTNCPANRNVPDWREIKCSPANDEMYDARLTGLPVASFTTTKFKGDLPNLSPYPRAAQEGSQHWRVRMPFHLGGYHPPHNAQFPLESPGIFIMHERPTVPGKIQVQLLCLKDSRLEMKLAKLLRNTFPKWELQAEDYERYFPGEQANDYDDDDIDKWFVNIHFIRPVQMQVEDSDWTPVLKHGGPHNSPNTYQGRPHNELLKEWAQNLVQRLDDNKTVVESLQELFLAVDNENTPEGPGNG